jgi:nitrite reductase/ring-hydroxylating ferredoxin subunit
MARGERLICAATDLVEAGPGARFEVAGADGPLAAFAVRVLGGMVRAYVNRCPHMGTELDWQPGDFFEESGLYLVCATHGALFEPATGFCVAGPCRGATLARLAIREDNGQVLLLNDALPAGEPDAKP